MPPFGGLGRFRPLFGADAQAPRPSDLRHILPKSRQRKPPAVFCPTAFAIGRGVYRYRTNNTTHRRIIFQRRTCMHRKTERQEIATIQEYPTKTKIELAIIYRPIEDLKPDSANPRRHTRKQVRQIAESIKAFGFNVPILIDRHGNIIAGHGRWLACRELGFTEVPTLCLAHLTPAQAHPFPTPHNPLPPTALSHA